MVQLRALVAYRRNWTSMWIRLRTGSNRHKGIKAQRKGQKKKEFEKRGHGEGETLRGGKQ